MTTMSTKPLRRLIASAPLLLATLTTAAGGESVFFSDNSATMRAVSPDGKTLVTLPSGVLGEPTSTAFTESTPNGPYSYRWFLATAAVGDGLTYPNGVAHQEVYAIRPTAAGGVIRVPLTALWSPGSGSETVRFNGDPARWSNGSPHVFFSFSGYRFDEFGTFVDQEYYRVALDVAAFDAAVKAGTWSPATLADLERVMGRSEALNPDGYAWVTFDGHHWSPDGTSLVRVQNEKYLIVRDVAARTERIVYTGSLQGTASWSPTGSKIAFGEYNGGGRIVTINPDGTAPKVIIQGSQKGFRIVSYTNPVWSPDAQSLACVRENWDQGQSPPAETSDVVRIPAGGTMKPVSLTSALLTDAGGKTTVAWRP